MTKTVFFDVETSGLEPSQHEIIQIAAIAIDDATGRELEVHEAKWHFDPGKASAQSLEMNSFDGEVWNREAVYQSIGVSDFDAFLCRHATTELISRRTGRPYRVAQLAGHNVSGFDVPFLRAAFGRRAKFLPASWMALDTLQLAIWWRQVHKPEIADLKLGTLAAHFGDPLVGAHDALADVRANVAVARHLVEAVAGRRAA